MKYKEVVIKIPQKDYDKMCRGELIDTILVAIKNGTPLPKGHGRLGDLDALEKLCYENDIGNSSFDGKPIIEQGQDDNGYIIWKPLFDFAHTIIEADKAESEE